MIELTRRGLIKSLGAAGAASLIGPFFLHGAARAQASGRVVVVGGGFGGATCAKYVRHYGPGVEVTLVERSEKYLTCPFSNTVLGGLHDMDFITHGYDRLKAKHGVNVVVDTVSAIDPAAKSVALKGGKSLSYDHLVVAPGIDFRWGAIEGYDEAASEVMPHAWKAGPQTALLRKQIQAMDDGGVVVIATPEGPFRAPSAPYERASMIAFYLKDNKSKSKILIVDARDEFEEKAQFIGAWENLYPGMIELIRASYGGMVRKADPSTMTVVGKNGESYKGNVINVIPPQKAGAIAQAAGLADDDGWCPVDQRTFESSKHKGVHVIGDSCKAGEMPKAASAASTQAKACAAAIVSSLSGTDMPEPLFVSVFYSVVERRYGISNAHVYRLVDGEIKAVSGGPSPEKESKKFRRREAQFAESWYEAITGDAFG